MTLNDLQDLITLASPLFPYSVIGGGAVRDAFLGAPIKDVDLFVDVRSTSALEFDVQAERFAKLLGGPLLTHAAGSVTGHLSTYHIPRKDLPTVELLPVVRDVYQDVHDYDFALSQILMTPTGLLYTPAFQLDVRNLDITYTKKVRQEKSASRLVRLRNKYPNYRPKNCEVLL
ncbi:hypothetical protein [Xylophilus sp.]|uniref:hypothetical protein n=1 Tax=Xylophilus sp. TaxID=2653893 RepID=UPI0013B70C84|nr:hypothetical protein [Xylophilus sp.]KAF1049342.1 MAG: hypothetical protein GAK38_00798 [Xylophilus sp.]